MNDIASETTRPVPELARSTQIRLVVIVIVVVLALFGVVPKLWPVLFPPPAEAPPHPDDGSFQATDRQWQTLRFETVHDRSFANAVATDGTIAVDDDRTTQVFSPFTGRVTRIFAQMGDTVKAGAPLFAVVANEAGQSDSDVMSGLAALKAAEAEEARLKDLAVHQGAAQKDWEAAQANLAAARGALVAAQARRTALGLSGGIGSGTLRGGEAIVRAPVSGVVTQRLIGVGQNIASATGGAATQAFAIGDFSKLWVVGNLREEDAMVAHVGQDALVTLLVDPAHPIHARLDYVAPMLDPNTRRLTVHATIDNPGGRIKPQMFATFQLLTGGTRTSLSVPESAVLYEGATARVWVAQPGSHRLAVRAVTAGQTVDGRVEIAGGLHDGETVVTAGSLFIDRGAHED